jgi:hypothetical protein
MLFFTILPNSGGWQPASLRGHGASATASSSAVPSAAPSYVPLARVNIGSVGTGNQAILAEFSIFNEATSSITGNIVKYGRAPHDRLQLDC